MNWRKRLSEQDSVRQFASVAEQILMSGSNMLASIVVVKVANIAQFGIYSFIFVFSTLILGIFGTLLHRQMMLKIASESPSIQKNTFFATLAIDIVGIIFIILTGIAIVALLSIRWDISSYYSLIAAGSAFTLLMVLFDAFKQYLYTTDNQAYSLRSTIIYIGIQLLLLALIVWKVPGEHVVAFVYYAFSVALIGSLAANRLCRSAITDAQWRGWQNTSQLFKGYYKQGRFSVTGMSIAWAQSQSINPFLMAFSGATTAGYFSLGRLMIMPMAVVRQGLVNSSTPTLRRLFKQGGLAPMSSKITTHLKQTFLFSAPYCALLLIGHFSGLFFRWIPEYAIVQWYLLFWVVLILCNIYRFWHGQFFIVSMQFKLLLRISIITVLVTLSGLLLAGLSLDSIYLALFSVIAGELTAIVLYLKHTRQQMHHQNTGNNH